MSKYTVYYDEDFRSRLSSLLDSYKQYPKYSNKFKNEINKFIENVAYNPKQYTPMTNRIRKAILIDIKINIYFVVDEENKEIYVYEIRSFRQKQDDVIHIK